MAFSKNKKFKKISTVIIGILAAGLIIFGVWGLTQRWQTTNNPNPIIPVETITHSTDKPDETPPPCDDSYQVPVSHPRQIEIPSQGINGCIQPVGIDQYGSVAVPTNVHLAGWLVNSPLPGEQGVSIIDGHVSGRYSDAIFGNLERLNSVDIIRVQFGDLSWKEFEVVDVKSYPINEATDRMYEKLNSTDNQLTLITCGGDFDKKSSTYTERIIVRTKLSS